MDSPLIQALLRAVAAAPQDVLLRLHLADQLVLAGDEAGAVDQIAAALRLEPDNEQARQAMARLLRTEPSQAAGGDTPGFDWAAAERQIADQAGLGIAELADPEVVIDRSRFTVDTPDVTLADVGGMSSVKERLDAAFLAPLANPRLREMYAKSLRGGLLLYGPPGCGKTFIARALAGELGAKFLSVGITDILEPLFGQSERNLHEAFQLARQEEPCVLFFDEIDALGARRTHQQASPMRPVVNQLLTELDGVEGTNEGVFLLAATNQPWDVDPALRRPGRLDRTVLVLPPDPPAREAIFRYHLRARPTGRIDLGALGRASAGLSGADIAHVCDSAAEQALLAGVRSGDPRPIEMGDLRRALGEITPSVGPWLETARNLVLFGRDDGTYTELRRYLKRSRLL